VAAVEKVELPTAPSAFPELKIPADNPQSPEKIALGRQLFFDARLSVDGTRSCYSCHQNEHGNGGETPLAVGAKEKPLTRHSPVIWNTAYFDAFYWDGRSASLEAQAKGAWGGGNMGVGADKLDAKAAELAKIRGYEAQFEKVFPAEGVTPDTIAKAISAYERTLLCKDTAYDRYAKGDASALTAEQKQGWALFMSKGQCAVCHAPPLFSSAMGVPGGLYYNVGIGTAGKADDQVDLGRYAVSQQDADWAAFKVPSLRNVSKSAPYFHDGSVATLSEAVKIMASGGMANKNKTPLLADRGLSTEELGALVAFLGSLDCEGTLDPPDLPK
jgi:cytochrome c peroxidase